MPLSPGDVLANHYRIEAEIGRGAFGRVYRARDIDLYRVVAIKELHKGEDDLGSVQFTDYVRRFEREARVLAPFNHPNIVHVYELLRLEGDRLYLVMEYVDGESLRDHLARRGPLPVDEAVRIMLDLLAGLAAVHADARDIVHRDIKPSNVMRTRGGQAKLTDFGLAQVGAESLRSLPTGQTHPGSPLYMSPEQETTSAYLYPASDVFSAGCVLFELLTGTVYKQAKRRKKGLTDSRPDTPEWLAEVIAQALVREVEERFADAGEMAAGLQEGQRIETDRRLAAERARQDEEERQAEATAKAGAEEHARQEEARRQAEAEAAAKAEAEERSQQQADRRTQALAAEAQQIFAQAKSYHNRGDYDRAIADYNRAIELDPQNALYWDSRSTSYHLKGDFDPAIADTSRAIELDPQNAKYWDSRSTSYHQKRDYDRAIADTSRAIELDPQNAAYWYSRGLSCHEKRDYDRAIADKSRAIELGPQNALYWQQRGVSYHAKRDYDRAIADKNRAIELDPQNAGYWYSRGVSYHEKRDYDRAIADKNRAIELDPQNAAYWDSRSTSYHLKGDYDPAIADTSRAIELDPQNAKYYHSRSLSYRARGDNTRADADAAKARSLGYKD